MRNIPALMSKFVVPDLSDSYLKTDRIRKLHHKMDFCKAAVLNAPAGYGKTTLTVSYFKYYAVKPFRVCWYRLDPEDRNLPVFTMNLVEVFFPAATQEFAESRKTLEDITDGHLQLYTAVSMICHEMWSYYHHREKARTYIVLDDFQNAAQIPEICDIIRYMLDNLPPSCSIFILSRASLPIFTEKQKIEKEILELTPNDLAFTNAEIEDLMMGMEHPSKMRKLTGFIQEITEGWIAGILILCQAVKSMDSCADFIDPERIGHEDALFRYMSVEVFRSVDGSIQDALARLALLQDFSENEASEIFRIHDIKSLMRQCLEFGMFIQKIPGNPVVYRFHSLFRGFLLTILKTLYTEEQIAQFHIAAARNYIDNAAYTRAAEHIAKCGRMKPAMDLVTDTGFNKILVGETAQLKLWLDLLPDDMIRDNPVLLMFKTQLGKSASSGEF